MRKFLIFISFLILLILAGLIVLIATFDADRYRSIFEKQLETALGMPVKIERIWLGWRNGIALEAKNVSMEPNDPVLASLTAKNLTGVLELRPLLKGEIRIVSLKISELFASVRLPKSAAGPSAHALEPPVQSRVIAETVPVSQKQTPQPSALPVFFINSFEIKNSSLHLIPPEPDAELITFNDIDATVKDLTLDKPMALNLKAAFLSGKQNIRLEGKMGISADDFSTEFKDVSVTVDLTLIQIESLLQEIPDLKPLGLAHSLGGTITGNIAVLEFDPAGGLKHMDAHFLLENGKISFLNPPLSLESVQARADLDRDTLEIHSASAQLENSKIIIAGTVRNWLSHPDVSFQGDVRNFNLSQWIPAAPGDPALTGVASISLQARSAADQWENIPNRLAGNGKLILEEPVLRNLNVLREVFGRISLIPGLVEKLLARLPPEYKDKIQEPDTVFDPIQMPFVINQKFISMPDIRVASETFQLNGAGTLSLDGLVQMQSLIHINKDISDAAIRSIRELEYLLNPQGGISLPLEIHGKIPDVRTKLDLQYIAQKLAVSKTTEMISGWLQKGEASQTPLPEGESVASSPNAPVKKSQLPKTPTQDQTQQQTAPTLLGLLLDSALEKLAPEENTK